MQLERVCPGCGADADDGARFCAACGRALFAVPASVIPGTPAQRVVESNAPAAPAVRQPKPRGEIHAGRVTLAVLAAFLLVVIALVTFGYSSAASAVQVTQVMSEGTFAVAVVVGLLVAFHIATVRD